MINIMQAAVEAVANDCDPVALVVEADRRVVVHLKVETIQADALHVWTQDYVQALRSKVGTRDAAAQLTAQTRARCIR